MASIFVHRFNAEEGVPASVAVEKTQSVEEVILRVRTPVKELDVGTGDLILSNVLAVLNTPLVIRDIEHLITE